MFKIKSRHEKKPYHDKRKKFTIIFDTETAPLYEELEEPVHTKNFKAVEDIHRFVEGSIKEYETKWGKRFSALITHKCTQIIFDFGYTIASIDGKTIYEKRNFLVDEVFTDINIMKHAYYFEKFPHYLRMLNNNDIKLKRWHEIKQQLETDIINYRIRTVWAYNVNFDKGALTATNRVVNNTIFNLFIDYGIEVGCLWGWACETLLQNKKFIKQAITEGWLSDAKNIKTSAEVCYRYLAQDRLFVEDHTALSDSIIETYIYQKLKASGKKYSYNLNIQPWKLVKDFATKLGMLPIMS